MQNQFSSAALGTADGISKAWSSLHDTVHGQQVFIMQLDKCIHKNLGHLITYV